MSFRNLKYIDIANIYMVNHKEWIALDKMKQEEDKRLFKDILKDKINGMGQKTQKE